MEVILEFIKMLLIMNVIPMSITYIAWKKNNRPVTIIAGIIAGIALLIQASSVFIVSEGLYL